MPNKQVLKPKAPRVLDILVCNLKPIPNIMYYLFTESLGTRAPNGRGVDGSFLRLEGPNENVDGRIGEAGAPNTRGPDGSSLLERDGAFFFCGAFGVRYRMDRNQFHHLLTRVLSRTLFRNALIRLGLSSVSNTECIESVTIIIRILHETGSIDDPTA
jgi:hypothetical protein